MSGGQHPIRRTILMVVVVLAGPVWTQARAQWDLRSRVSLQSTWADNVDYSSGRNPNGDVVTALSLAGSGIYQGPRWGFDATYAPSWALYRDRTDLNRVSHAGRLQSSWEISRRVQWRIRDTFLYTPDQGANSQNVSSPVVLTGYTNRRGNTANTGLVIQVSEASTLAAGISHDFQSYGDPDLADFAGVGLNTGWSTDLRNGSRIEVNARASRNRFERRFEVPASGPTADPNDTVTTIRHTRNAIYSGSVGGQVPFRSGLTGRALVGYDVVVPDQGGGANRRGMHTEAAVSWRGTRLNMETGYNRSLSTGSGAFAASWSETWFTGARARFGSFLNGTLYFNRSTSQSAQRTSGGEVVTTGGEVSLEADFNRTLTARASASRSVQTSRDSGASDIDFNRFTVGLVARLD